VGHANGRSDGDSREAARARRPEGELPGSDWERRFVTDGSRVAEVIQLYTELGYQVRVEPMGRADLPQACEECQLAALLRFQTIYTRKPGGGDSQGHFQT